MTDRATLVKALRILARDIDSIDGAANAVCEEAANVIEERRWIPVGERLPELGVDVLAIGREGVFEARLAVWGESRRWEPLILDCHGCGCCGGGEPNVTHWQPRPAPPKGGEVAE